MDKEFNHFFNQDIRDKKRIASGIHHRTGKRGYTGRIMFPSDYLNKKDKKIYQGSSEVIVSSIYETIIPLNEFKPLKKEEKIKYLKKWFELYKVNEIARKMGTTQANVFYYKNAYLNNKKKINKPKKQIAEAQQEEIKKPKQVDTLSEGFSISFCGIHTGIELQSKFEKLGIILDEDSEYSIILKVTDTGKRIAKPVSLDAENSEEVRSHS